MKKNDIFTFTAPNGVEVTAIVINVEGNLHQEGLYWVNYICYAQNRLFYIGQMARGIHVLKDNYIIDFTPEFIGELEMESVIVDYAVLPEYDEMLERYNDLEVAQAETANGM